MFERFSENARKVMSLARQEAQRLDSQQITADHLLLGIIREGAGVATKVLEELRVDLDRLRQDLEDLINPKVAPGRIESVDQSSDRFRPLTSTLGQIPFSPRAKRTIELAGQASTLLGHSLIGTEHLLLGLLMENECVAAQVMINRGLKLDQVRDMVVAVVGEAL